MCYHSLAVEYDQQIIKEKKNYPNENEEYDTMHITLYSKMIKRFNSHWSCPENMKKLSSSQYRPTMCYGKEYIMGKFNAQVYISNV